MTFVHITHGYEMPLYDPVFAVDVDDVTVVHDVHE